jgi:nucleoside-diphosphate-sugar epimerase
VARPCFIVGEHFDNSGLRAFLAKFVLYPEPGRSYYQFLWDSDLVNAYAAILMQGLTGIYNIAPADHTSVEEISSINGSRLISGPLRVLEIGADLLFRLHLAPFSGHWVTLGDPLLDSGLLRSTTDWRPSASSAEALQRYIAVARNP